MFLHIIGRKEARERGIRFYFTGTPCSRGSIALRRVSSSKCICSKCKAAHLLQDSQRLERASNWRKHNPERQKAHERRWRLVHAEDERKRLSKFHEDHPEKRREYSQRSYGKNSGNILARKRSYYRAHPDRALVYVVKRRAAKLNRTPPWLSPEHQAQIRKIYRRAALMRAAGNNVHVDHIIPLVGKLVSGLHVPWNLAIIPAKDNQRKSNQFFP